MIKVRLTICGGKINACAVGLFLLLSWRAISADTLAPEVTLGSHCHGLTVGPTMNAAGKDLRGSRFVGQNLSQAKFDGCDLREVLFHDCQLTHASFVSANLKGCIIDSCNYENARFEGATIQDVRGFDGELSLSLSAEQLKSTRSYQEKALDRCLIIGTVRPNDRSDTMVDYDFSGASLRESVFLQGDCTKCSFSGARFSGKILNCRINSQQLASMLHGQEVVYRLRITGHMKDLRLPPLVYNDCDLGADGLEYDDAFFVNCRFIWMITGKQLKSTANYKLGDLSGLTFEQGQFSGIDFSAQNLTGTKFLQCDLTSAIFDDAVVTKAWFGDDSDLGRNTGFTRRQLDTSWNARHGRLEGILLPEDTTGTSHLDK